MEAVPFSAAASVSPGRVNSTWTATWRDGQHALLPCCERYCDRHAGEWSEGRCGIRAHQGGIPDKLGTLERDSLRACRLPVSFGLPFATAGAGIALANQTGGIITAPVVDDDYRLNVARVPTSRISVLITNAVSESQAQAVNSAGSSTRK